MTNDKKLKIGGIVIGLLFFCFFAFVALQNGQYNKKLRKEGIKTKAQVIAKDKLVTNKGKTKERYLTLAVFEDTTAIVQPKEKINPKDAKNIDDKIDAIFDNLNTSASKPIGNYTTITITVPSEEYNSANMNDFVDFVYLKDEIKKGKLYSMID
ncbi:MAG: hypothetical protein H6553_00775 [Chitinophagales bacterium]|nr:hypothetical protein [Chitinophagales bacterium]